MKKDTGLQDIKKNKLYVGDKVEFKRKNIIETGIIIDKSHQFGGVYFIQSFQTKQLVLLKEQFIQKFHIQKI